MNPSSEPVLPRSGTERRLPRLFPRRQFVLAGTPSVRAAAPRRSLTVSVILATKNRAVKLRLCLQSLDTIFLRKFGGEIVVVDNGSTDETPRVLEEFARTCPCDFKTVRHPEGGLSAARNAGLSRAGGEWICIFDDDIYPVPGYFETLLPLLDGSFDFCSGRVLLFDAAAAKTSVSESETPREFRPGMLLRAGLLHGCHFIVRRTVFDQVGNFDPSLGAGTPIPSGEDHDFLCRALNAGFRGRYFPELRIYHDHGRGTGSPEAARADRSYSLGRGAVYFKRILEGDVRYLAHWAGTLRPRALHRLADEIRGAACYWSARQG